MQQFVRIGNIVLSLDYLSWLFFWSSFQWLWAWGWPRGAVQEGLFSVTWFKIRTLLFPADFNNSWHSQGQFRAQLELCRVAGYVWFQNDCSAYSNFSFSIFIFSSRWLWTEAGAQSDLESSLGIGGFGYPAMAAVNARKMKFALLKGSFSEQGINEFLRCEIFNWLKSFCNWNCDSLDQNKALLDQTRLAH